MLILPRYPRDYSTIEDKLNKLPLNNPIIFDPEFQKTPDNEFERTNRDPKDIRDIRILNIRDQYDIIKYILGDGWNKQSSSSRGDEEYSSSNKIIGDDSDIHQKLSLVSSRKYNSDLELQSLKWEISYIEWKEVGGWTNSGFISDPKMFRNILEQIIIISKMVFSKNIDDQNLAREIIKNQFK